MKVLSVVLALVFSLVGRYPVAQAETTLCNNIASLPATISAPGVYCLKQDLGTSITSGNAITINANSVTIDFNGYKLGGLGGGPATQATGVYAADRKNITLRNGNIRGFRIGVYLNASGAASSSGHLVEDSVFDGNRVVSIFASGVGTSVRNNRVIDTGLSPSPAETYGIYGIHLSGGLIEGNSVTNTSAATKARSIFVFGSAEVEISGNRVSGTTATTEAYGVGIEDVDQAVIVGNTISDIRSSSSLSSSIGILMTEPAVAIVSDNRISTLRAGFGIVGIAAGGDPAGGIDVKAVCRNNTLVDMVIGESGCDQTTGTVHLP